MDDEEIERIAHKLAEDGHVIVNHLTFKEKRKIKERLREIKREGSDEYD